MTTPSDPLPQANSDAAVGKATMPMTKPMTKPIAHHSHTVPRIDLRFPLSILLIFVLALGLRIGWSVSSPYLENDEAALAWNIESRGLAGLASPMDFSQGASIGFLALSSLSRAAFGESVYAYRLVPLIFGLLLIFSTASLARKLLPTASAWGAILLVACSASLVHYSAFFKPYTLDAFACTLVLTLFAGWVTSILRQHAVADGERDAHQQSDAHDQRVTGKIVHRFKTFTGLTAINTL